MIFLRGLLNNIMPIMKKLLVNKRKFLKKQSNSPQVKTSRKCLRKKPKKKLIKEEPKEAIKERNIKCPK